MVVQKWDPTVNLDKKEPNTLPLWIKMMSPHLESWINKGLSALASRIGSPLIMDAMTTRMCNQGTGSLGYARVLVEVNADKGSEENIDIFYKNKVFGHSNSKCSKLKPEEHAHERTKKDKKEDAIAGENLNKEDTHENYSTPKQTQKKSWKVDDKVIKDVRCTANNFSVLQDIKKESLDLKLINKEKEEVDKYKKKNEEDDVTDADTDIELDENDVYIDRSGTAKFMTINEVSILETHLKKDRIDKVCMNIFGSWSWQNNVRVSRKGCRIAVGWDCNNVKCSLINATEQSMLYNVNSAWVIMGDVNVSLNLEDHSEGMSNFTQDMIDFQERVNETELEDINCSSVHFTLTKSLLNTSATVLKKLDRVMSNPIFGKGEVDINIHGHAMYRLVKKLKILKPHLNWKNGNLFGRVIELKTKLQNVQSMIDKDPTNKVLRAKGVEVLQEFKEAVRDEEKLLRQKTKVTWLKEGDKNSAYFHKVIK
ncbi:RNA-directed DNA polymerase, eukaryota, reverse transcriptase zinc-binding domain protein [Tanacetum coccineum]